MCGFVLHIFTSFYIVFVKCLLKVVLSLLESVISDVKLNMSITSQFFFSFKWLTSVCLSSSLTVTVAVSGSENVAKTNVVF